MFEMMQPRLIGIRDNLLVMECSCFFNRILLTYGDNGEIILRGKGSGGLNEMKKKLHDNQIYVGVARIRAVDDHGSRRAKFVYINYVGVNVVSLFRSIFLICNMEFCDY